MACPRCDTETTGTRWCAECERAYDLWSRRYATDIILPCVVGGVIVSSIALVLPLLGVGSLIAATGVFAGFGALVGMFRLTKRKRRRQFLAGAAVPRAYLPEQS
jgi:hypothetical protein